MRLSISEEKVAAYGTTNAEDVEMTSLVSRYFETEKLLLIVGSHITGSFNMCQHRKRKLL
jgi:hypothetical protein